MRRLVPFFICAALALAGGRPNFSGTWKQNAARSDFNGLPAPISVVDIITHQEPWLHLTQTVVGPHGDSTTSEHDFSTDNKERAGKPRNYTERSTVRWDGNALVFISRRDYNGREMTIRERWTVSADGSSLVKERVSPSPKGEIRQTFVLERQ